MNTRFHSPVAHVPAVVVLIVAGWLNAATMAVAEPAGGAPAKLPFVEIDLPGRRVLVECQAIRIDAPLEFLCVAINGPEHEAVLRTPAKPSDIHLALLAIGLEPGEPARFSEAANQWFPPTGPPVRISVRFNRGGEEVTLPASRLMRDLRTGQAMPDRPWVFTGSRMLEDRRYAADVTGYVVSVVNFDLSPLDVPRVASNANELLEWEINPEVAPEMGAKVTMILEPVGAVEPSPTDAPSTMPVGGTGAPARSTVTVDQAHVDALRRLWETRVAPHDAALREASAAQYKVIRELRREQQRLIDEADRIQRLIDELERKYQDMTTPRPEPLDENAPRDGAARPAANP